MHATQAVQRLRKVIRRQHRALATEESYVHWLGRYIHALREMRVTWTSEEELQRILTHWACGEDEATSANNSSLNAVALFYNDILRSALHDVNALVATRPR